MKRYLFLSAILCLFTIHIFAQTFQKNTCWNGKWAVVFSSNDIGDVRTFLDFDFTDSTFTTCTRKNADKDILGSRRSFLARHFTSNFKNGSLINVTNGKTTQRNDSLFLRGIFRCAIGNYYFRGFIYHDSLHVNLLNANEQPKGTITGKRTNETALPDYISLIQKTLELAKKNIFSKTLTTSKNWKTFEKNILRTSTKVKDDLEMEFAFFYYAGKLPVSHFSLLRISEHNNTISEKQETKNVTLEQKTPETVYMKITSFGGSKEEMDSAFHLITVKQYKNLIVDLRDNPGGSIEAGMSFAQHVADSSFYGGVFLTQKWYDTHTNIPSVQEYNTLSLFTESNFDLIIDGIHQQEGLCLKIIPAEERFNGRVFILTNGATASTCEPLVYGLKQQKRAIIVGEKTAGAMLNGEFFKVSDDFSVIIPTADYYASDGYKIDQKGVLPDIAIDQKTALEYVLENLVKN